VSFELTPRQQQATALIGGPAMHTMLFGGSRSGKTFVNVRTVVLRALAAAKSRHAVMRFRFNHVKASVVLDTFPKVMDCCFPGITYGIDKTDWYARLPNGSEIWFGGLDDKERTEKILGQEYATLFFNECSQIPYASRNLAMTRLAQSVTYMRDGQPVPLRLKALYDCNPPSQAHWTYQLFKQNRDPETRQPLPADQFASMQMNPRDNEANLPSEYIRSLEGMSLAMRRRFLDGEFASATENALWTLETLDRWRSIAIDLPELQRIVVAVDPSGAGDEDNAGNDEIGIVVAALGKDGNAYLLEDLTCKGGPLMWGKVAANAFERHRADLIVAEKNFGGEMVRMVLQTARPRTPVKLVTASRGKTVRAEPIASLCETGKVRFVGHFSALEEELCAFSTTGYLGERSPNRADAFVWAMSELFPGMVKEVRAKVDRVPVRHLGGVAGWMGA